MKLPTMILTCLSLSPFCIAAEGGKMLSVPDEYHVISIKGAAHNIQTGQTLQLKAVSNKDHNEFSLVYGK